MLKGIYTTFESNYSCTTYFQYNYEEQTNRGNIIIMCDIVTNSL